MIEYNTKEGSDARRANVPPTLAEEYCVIQLLNVMAQRHPLVKGEVDLLQRFVNHYQNLSHYKAYTCGLWATDRKELATDPDFFQIEF